MILCHCGLQRGTHAHREAATGPRTARDMAVFCTGLSANNFWLRGANLSNATNFWNVNNNGNTNNNNATNANGVVLRFP